MKKTSIKSRILAWLSVVAILATTFGAMPVAFATEDESTTVDLLPLVDFNSGWFNDGTVETDVWTAANKAITVTDNQKFRVGAIDSGKNLSILSHKGNSNDKYLQSGSNNLYYQSTTNPSLDAHKGLVAGDTLVVSADFNTVALDGATKYAKFRAKANIGAENPADLTYFALTPDNEFVLYNGANTEMAYLPVPDDEWISINVVYAVGESSITASVYVNGHLQKLVKVSDGELADVNTLTYTTDNRFTAPYTRFYFEYGCWDNLRVSKISGGSFDASTLEKKPYGIEVVPTINFDTVTAAAPPAAAGYFNSAFKPDGTPLKNRQLYDGTLAKYANYAGDTTADVAGKGILEGDTYRSGVKDTRYMSSKNSGYLSKYTKGLLEGEQVVISFKTLSSINLNLLAKYEGKRFVSTENTTNGAPEGAPAAVEIDNYSLVARTMAGSLRVLNGEPKTGKYAVNETNYTVSDDTLSEAELPIVDTNKSRTKVVLDGNWVTVTVVLTAGSQTVDTPGSAEAAEVVTVTKPDTITAYVNNVKAFDETPLTENNLFRGLAQFDFTSGALSCIDDFSVDVYKGDSRFDDSAIPGFADKAAEAIGWYGNSIYIDGTETADQLITKIESLASVEDCVLATIAGAQVTGTAYANTASHAIVTGKGGRTYPIPVVQKSTLDSVMETISLDGDDTVVTRDKEDPNTKVNQTGVSYEKFGKGSGELAYTWTTGLEEEELIWKRSHLFDLAGSHAVFGGDGRLNAVASKPFYMTFDVLHDGSLKANAQEGNNIRLFGNMYLQDVATGDLDENYTLTSLMNINTTDEGLEFSVNSGDSANSIIKVADGNQKQWYNVAIQLWPCSDKIDYYIDGELVMSSKFCRGYVSIFESYFDIYRTGFHVDNVVADVGVYNPVPKAPVSLDFPELAEGYEVAEDGKTLIINKNATIDEDVVAGIVVNGGEISGLTADGEAATFANEIDQILVKAGDSLHYYPIKTRTGMSRTEIADGRWMIDVADGMGNSTNAKVYIAKYEDGILTNLTKCEVDKVDGDTWFTDAEIEDGDRVFVWGTDGKITPVYKEIIAKIVCWGDSLTEGVAGNGVTYPDELAKMLIDYQVANMGVAGESLITIAARSGALNIIVGEDLDLPADRTEVDIKISSTELFNEEDAGMVAPCSNSRGGWNPVTIILEDGTEIKGTLNTAYALNEDGVHALTKARFTRSEKGEEVEIPAGSKIKIDAHDVEGDINIYWAGTNRGWDNTDTSDCDADDLIIALKKMILENAGYDMTEFASNTVILNADLSVLVPDAKYIVLGLTAEGCENRTPGVNEELAQAFGDNFLDLKEYLATEGALTDAGIEATEQDIEYIADGKVPFSLLGGYRYPNEPERADETHFNEHGYRLIAKQVYNKIIALGY